MKKVNDNKNAPIKWQYVKSSNLYKVAYDIKYKKLHIVFMYDKHKEYVYENVNNVIYMNLVRADSKGDYFQSKIKDRYVFSTQSI